MLEPLKLVLHNHNFLGDVICMTCAVRDIATPRRCVNCGFECDWAGQGHIERLDCPLCNKDTLLRKYMVRVETSFPQLWENNPYISQFDSPDMVLKIGPGIGTQQSNTSGKHMCEAYRDSILFKTSHGITFPQGELIPDLHFSEYELNKEPVVEGRYWLICLGRGKSFSSKTWPYEYWQEVVNSLPHITFVQIGHSSHNHPPMLGSNVINMVGRTEDPQTGIRDLLHLFMHCDGSAGLVSMHAHLAAALRKPAVVVAGAREPVRFELYPFHRYLSNQGAMRCIGEDTNGNHRNHSSIYSCWKDSVEACPNRDGKYTKCLTMIKPEEVTKAITDYYTGGMLDTIDKPATVSVKQKKVFKLFCNTHGFGGGERSTLWIANAMLNEGYDVQLVSPKKMCREYYEALPKYVKVTNKLTEPCDIFMCYSNDMVMGMGKNLPLLQEIKADRKIMVLNYRLGDVGKVDWTCDWDKYMFLCSELRDGFLERVPDAKTVVLAPPVDLKPFIDVELGSLNKTLHIVRVSSQGDKKYPPDFDEYVKKIKENNPNCRMTLMPGPNSLTNIEKVNILNSNSKPVIDVLRQGTVFWYMLPEKYLDNGPRVIVEAMALGLPVVADNRGGAKDRVTEETGWLCDTPDQHIEVLSNLDGKVLTQKGLAAKERAREEFDPQRWIGEICG